MRDRRRTLPRTNQFGDWIPSLALPLLLLGSVLLVPKVATHWPTLGTEQWLTLIGLLSAAAGFTVGLWQYRIAERWKHNEWAAGEAARFLDSGAVRIVTKLLDWSDRYVPLAEGRKWMRVRDDDVQRAFRVPTTDEVFRGREALLRDAFSDFRWT
jgi:hypothetical protein